MKTALRKSAFKNGGSFDNSNMLNLLSSKGSKYNTNIIHNNSHRGYSLHNPNSKYYMKNLIPNSNSIKNANQDVNHKISTGVNMFNNQYHRGLMYNQDHVDQNHINQGHRLTKKVSFLIPKLEEKIEKKSNYISIASKREKVNLLDIKQWLPNVIKQVNSRVEDNDVSNFFISKVILKKQPVKDGMKFEDIQKIVKTSFEGLDFYSDKIGVFSRLISNFDSVNLSKPMKKIFNKSLSSTRKNNAWKEIKEVMPSRQDELQSILSKSIYALIESQYEKFLNLSPAKHKLLFASNNFSKYHVDLLKHFKNATAIEKTEALTAQLSLGFFSFMAENKDALLKELNDMNGHNDIEQFEEIVHQYIANVFGILNDVKNREDIDEYINSDDFASYLNNFMQLDLLDKIGDVQENTVFNNILQKIHFIEENDIDFYEQNKQVFDAVKGLSCLFVCNSLKWNTYRGVQTRGEGLTMRQILKNGAQNKDKLLKTGADAVDLVKSFTEVSGLISMNPEEILHDTSKIFEGVLSCFRADSINIHDVNQSYILPKDQIVQFFRLAELLQVKVDMNSNQNDNFFETLRKEVMLAVSGLFEQKYNDVIHENEGYMSNVNSDITKSLADNLTYDMKGYNEDISNYDIKVDPGEGGKDDIPQQVSQKNGVRSEDNKLSSVIEGSNEEFMGTGNIAEYNLVQFAEDAIEEEELGDVLQAFKDMQQNVGGQDDMVGQEKFDGDNINYSDLLM